MTTNNFTFAESDYRFTSPVRYFTATDPYYWEVDNIPLKQLQENDLWLKNQIEEGFKNLSFNTKRSDFQELLPFSNSVDNIVRVKPGRYTARINDATSNPRLQELTKVFGQVFDEPNKWRFASYSDEDLKASIDRITSEVASDALFMNGLIERVFTYPVKSPNEAFDEIEYSEEQRLTYQSPLLRAFFWPGTSYGRSEWWQDITKWNEQAGMFYSLLVENLLVKFWRGTFRLSVVDVSEELSIEVPEFNQRDFDYYDENGVLQQNNSVATRIDLLFIYSKPIDASAVKIKSTSLTNYRTITKPELGLVRGAGMILVSDLGDGFGGEAAGSTERSLDDNDNIRILASPADSANTNGGFNALNVRGSFPSPDDLMNVAPLLLENLEASDPRLVGQSVLPVAYVVVRRDAADNEFGEVIITNNDLIDIRPFFRTAELAYNERAGIAAAVPQISISNPVVSDMKLKYVTNEIIEDYQAKLARLEERFLRSTAENSNRPRVIGAGMVQGGSRFGPEGAIRRYYERYQGLDRVESLERLREIYNLPTGHATNYFPEWDVAPWVPNTDRKEYPNDCVFVHLHTSYEGNSGNDDNFSYLGSSSKSINGGPLEHLINDSLFFFCKKTIKLNREAVEWMDHYTVQAHLVNCVPISHQGQLPQSGSISLAGASDIWIEYQRDEFTIYCAWPAMQNVPVSETQVTTGFPNFLTRFGNSGSTSNTTSRSTIYKSLFSKGLVDLRDNPEVTAGFTVLTQELSGQNRNRVINGGVCIYPTIKFEIIGYPRYWSAMPRSLAAQNPTINLI